MFNISRFFLIIFIVIFLIPVSTFCMPPSMNVEDGDAGEEIPQKELCCPYTDTMTEEIACPPGLHERPDSDARVKKEKLRPDHQEKGIDWGDIAVDNRCKYTLSMCECHIDKDMCLDGRLRRSISTFDKNKKCKRDSLCSYYWATKLMFDVRYDACTPEIASEGPDYPRDFDRICFQYCDQLFGKEEDNKAAIPIIDPKDVYTCCEFKPDPIGAPLLF